MHVIDDAALSRLPADKHEECRSVETPEARTGRHPGSGGYDERRDSLLKRRRAPNAEGRQTPKGAKRRRAPNAEGRQTPKGAKRRRAPNAEGRQTRRTPNGAKRRPRGLTERAQCRSQRE